MYCKKKTKHPYLLQYKLSYKNKTGTNHHGLLKNKLNTSINSNTNHRREMKLIPVNMAYTLLKFE